MIYVSVPKTGTNSVHSLLGNNKYNHLKVSMIVKLIGPQAYNNEFSFAFVRNPFDLVKSWYYYHKYSPNVVRQDVKNFYPDTIEEWADLGFLTHWETTAHKKYNPHWDMTNPLFQKSWSHIGDKQVVSKLYRFDDLDIVMRYLTGKIITHENSSSQNEHVLSDHVCNLIREGFKEDIALYNSVPVFTTK